MTISAAPDTDNQTNKDETTITNPYIADNSTSNKIVIDSKWKTFTKNLAKKVIAGDKIDKVYDLNDDGTITMDELEQIDNIYSQLLEIEGTKSSLRRLKEKKQSK